MAGHWTRKEQVSFYEQSNNSNTGYRLTLVPSTYQITYTDITSSSSSTTFTEKWQVKKKVKKKDKKGKVVKDKKGNVQYKTVKKDKKKNHTVDGTADKAYLTGYDTTLTLTFNVLTDAQMSALLRCIKTGRTENVNITGTYTDNNGQTKTYTWTKKNMAIDKTRITFYEPWCQCFCSTFFDVQDIDFATSLKKNGVIYYEDVTLQFVTATPRKPFNKWAGTNQGQYIWQHTTAGIKNTTGVSNGSSECYYEADQEPKKKVNNKWVADHSGYY